MEQSDHRRVKFTGGFWRHFEEVNRTSTIPQNYQQFSETGRVDSLKLEWRKGQAKQPHKFWDSDVAKWMEAAAFSLMKTPDKELEATLDEIIGYITRGQMFDGYFNSFFQQCHPEERWNCLRLDHELYCAGHLIEAAVACHEATGNTRFLDAMCRFADYIDQTFGPEADGKIPGYPGHQEIELALVKLYRATGNEKYLGLSKFFIDERGTEPNFFTNERERNGIPPEQTWNLAYFQAHQPVREQQEAVGHAVRACYLYSGMADVARETNDQELAATCRRLWNDIVNTKMYITGGIGSCHHGETFSNAYDLPNEEAYAETCAAISLIFFAQRMFMMEKKGEYIDVLERALYNGASSGISLDGKSFFYVNPMASYPDGLMANGKKHIPRPEWFACSCCPPNVARLRASLGQYFYDCSDTGIRVNLYNTSTAALEIGGRHVELTQTTDYPWDGKISLELKLQEPMTFELALRIPGWCDNASLKLNERHMDLKPLLRDGYAYIKRSWNTGDQVELELPMPVKMIHAHPKVRHDCGRVALTRGPLVYCIEQHDNGPDLNAIELPESAEFTLARESGLLENALVLHADAFRIDQASWGEDLYSAKVPGKLPCRIKAIPYFCWGNRQFGEMLVWIRKGAVKELTLQVAE